jgi:hypothetical protein
VVLVEVTVGQMPMGQAALCREHQAALRREGARLLSRSLLQPPPRRPEQIRRVAQRNPKPPDIAWAAIPVPNTQVLEISGDYTGQLAARLSSAAASIPSPRQRRALA